MQQLGEEEDYERPIEEIEPLREEEVQSFELFQYVRQLLQGSQIWAFLAVMGGIFLAVLIQSGW